VCNCVILEGLNCKRYTNIWEGTERDRGVWLQKFPQNHSTQHGVRAGRGAAAAILASGWSQAESGDAAWGLGRHGTSLGAAGRRGAGAAAGGGAASGRGAAPEPSSRQQFRLVVRLLKGVV